MSTGIPELSELCIVGTMWRYFNAGSLKPRKPLYPYCTKSSIIFLGSPSPKLPFDMIITLVQTRYHGDKEATNFRDFALSALCVDT